MTKHKRKHMTNWIKSAIKKPGSLHASLNIPQGQKIPSSRLAIKPGDSTLMKRRKSLAKTLSKFHKK